PDQFGFASLTVGEDDEKPLASIDNMPISDDMPLVIDDEPGAGADRRDLFEPAELLFVDHTDHGRANPLDNIGNRLLRLLLSSRRVAAHPEYREGDHQTDCRQDAAERLPGMHRFFPSIAHVHQTITLCVKT